MTHRSVGVFIIVAALLVAVPQASRDLLELAGSAGDQARTAMLRTFLGLNAGASASPAARRRTASLVASCQAPAAEHKGAPRHSQAAARSRQESQSSHADAEAAGAAQFELAMILDRPEAVPHAPVPADFHGRLKSVEFGRSAAHNPKDAAGLSELAMIIPPDAAIPPLAAALNGKPLKSGAPLVVKPEVNPQVLVAGRLAGEANLFREAAVEIRREMIKVKKEGEASKFEALVKVRGARPAPKKADEPDACGAPQFIKVAAVHDGEAAPVQARRITLSE
ncbi:MAG TPA: hypothetical protein VEY09_06375 [Pyrinomonadaceae bacterium]|nr:hypothetical protein [Pyrinomonadaceae bacterium]